MEQPNNFYVDQYGQKWPVWGDKNQAEMAEWVESIYQQTKDSELKAKLMIFGGLVVTVALGYSIWQIRKNLPKWRDDRNKVKNAEEVWKEERLRIAKTDMTTVIYDIHEINAPRLNGYFIKDLQSV